MLASISPLGERARGNRWETTTFFYVAASITGGAVLGAGLGWIGSLVGISPETPAVLALGALILVVAAVLDGVGLRPPGPRRQVNEHWLDELRGWVYGTGFGFQLGLGMVTIVSTWAMWAAFALAFVSGSPAGGAVIGACFGLVRAVPLLAVAGAESPDRLRSVHIWLRGFRRPAGTASSILLVALASLLVAVAT